MTTVTCWDEYNYEDQQLIIKENNLMKTISNYLEATITLQAAWGTTTIFIDPKYNTRGCKSYLLSYLLQKTGLKNIRVSREQHNIINTEEYTYTQIKEALTIILEHPEWITEFKQEYKNNKTLTRFTFQMTKKELKNYI